MVPQHSPTITDALCRAGVIGFWQYSSDSGLISSNADMARLYGIDPDEAASGVPPTVYRRALHPDDRKHAAAALDAALEGWSPYQVTYRVMGPDGALRLVQASGRPKWTASTFELNGIILDISIGSLGDRLADSALAAANFSRMIGDDLLRYLADMLLLATGQRLAGDRPKVKPAD